MHKNYDVYVNMTFFSSAASGVPLERSWDTNSNTSEHMFVQILCMCTYIYILHYILLHIYKLLIYIYNYWLLLHYHVLRKLKS